MSTYFDGKVAQEFGAQAASRVDFNGSRHGDRSVRDRLCHAC